MLPTSATSESDSLPLFSLPEALPGARAADGEADAGSIESFEVSFGAAQVFARADQIEDAVWQAAFARDAKDDRYYRLCERTLRQANFHYRYLLLRDRAGAVRALQPFFFTDQDILAGLSVGLRTWVERVRRRFPRFMTLKMLMVGCTAGEGHLGLTRGHEDTEAADGLLEAFHFHGKAQGAFILTFKDFTKEHRPTLTPAARRRGYVRMPSFPSTVIDLRPFADFEEYLARRLSKSTRKSLRRKFRPDDAQSPVTMEVLTDVSRCVDEIHPLYLQVLAHSSYRFEELTKEFFVGLGRTMGDRARFFIWRQAGKAVAVSLGMVHEGTFYDNYLGLDYAVAYDLSLYFLTIRDLFNWAVGQGLSTYYSTPLNYDPKLHLRFSLEPLDLYVRHVSKWINPFFTRIAPLLEPTRYDKLLPRFENQADLK